MTPKEKALEIVSKMFATWYQIPYEAVQYHLEVIPVNIISEWYLAKENALIAVDEILNSILGNYEFDFLRKYWQEVKQEIEKL